MTPEDEEAFVDLWLDAAENLAGRRPDARLAVHAYAALERFELAEIALALETHALRSDWIARPVHIVRLIEGELPEPPVLLAAAHANRQTIAVPLRMMLGGDLVRHHPKALEARIAAGIDLLARFHRRATVGAFSAEELARCIGAGIDPAGPIGPALPPPRARYREAIRRRVAVLRDRRRLAAPERRGRRADPWRGLRPYLDPARIAELEAEEGRPGDDETSA